MDNYCLIVRIQDMEDTHSVEWFETKQGVMLAYDEAVENRGEAYEHIYVAKVVKHAAPGSEDFE